MAPHTVTLVHAPACHFCADAQAVLAELSREYPIEITLVAAASAAGQALVEAHRPAMLPLILIDGEYFSAGRLPRRKLSATLSTLSRLAPAARPGPAPAAGGS